MKRRRFVASALAGGAALGCLGESVVSRALRAALEESRRPPPWGGTWDLRYFTPGQAIIADALLERLLPGDPARGRPGAREAHVVVYVDRSLVERPELSMKTTVDLLAAVDAAAHERTGVGFAEADGQVQDEIIVDVQRGEIPGLTMVFDQLLVRGLEGFLGSPNHGGNHERVAWRWLGLDPSCTAGACGEH